MGTQVIWALCSAWEWRVWAAPMTEKGSPYSERLQFAMSAERATRTAFSVHEIVEAWWTPKLCESSWALVRSVIELLFQVSLPGR